MQEGSSCIIDQNDPRLAGQQVAFLLESMRCRLLIDTSAAGAGRRSSVYEEESAATPAKYRVYAALAVTDQKFLLVVQRFSQEGLKDHVPHEYVHLAFTDQSFTKMFLEYSNEERHTYLGITLPNAEQFLGPSTTHELGVPENSTVKIIITTYKAPDIAMHINRLMTSIAAEQCSIHTTDARLAGQKVVYLLNSVACRLRIDSMGTGKRSSVYETQDTASQYVVYAALAATEEKLIVDVMRLRKDSRPIEYLCAHFTNPLWKDVDLSFANNEETSQLVITLPGAERWLGPMAASQLELPPQSCIRVFIDTWKAPDIAMHVKARIGR